MHTMTIKAGQAANPIAPDRRPGQLPVLHGGLECAAGPVRQTALAA
jgi:hypothetical protein